MVLKSILPLKSKIDGTFQVIASQADQGFEILDQILNFLLKFEDNDIKKIKKQIEASLKIDEFDISTLSNDNFNKFFFKKHKFSKKNIKGTIESIKNITKADLKLHHKKLFNSNSLHIGASGNIEGEKLKGYLEEVFGKFNNEFLHCVQKI